ncbi:MAG: hypothetical protein Q8K75_06355 [Chlamydiales bacterium]|nr:hypothetical protein [Chlamydiales bacterium]
MNREKKNTVVIEGLPEPFVDRLATWIQQYGSQVLYGFAAVVVCLLALYAWSSRTAGYEEQDYINAEVAYEEFSISPTEQTDPAVNKSFLALKEILERRPELGSRYNGLIAQTFLRLGDMKMALAYGQKALKNLSDENLPFYEDYSKTSLLIADGSYGDALKRSEFLAKKMSEAATKATTDQERGFGDTLLIYNAIRIAMLNQKLSNGNGELAAWQEVQRLGGDKKSGRAAMAINDATYADAMATFKTGKVGLNDYIEARKKTLRQ